MLLNPDPETETLALGNAQPLHPAITVIDLDDELEAGRHSYSEWVRSFVFALFLARVICAIFPAPCASLFLFFSIHTRPLRVRAQ
jgi:hypothetical protein